MLDIPGDPGTSRANEFPFAAPVLRVRRLAFLLPFSVFIGGLMNDGDGEDGADNWNASVLGVRFNAKLLGFLALRGDGEVMGRSWFRGTRIVLLSSMLRLWNLSKPNVEPPNDERGTSVTGDSGDELGEGSESEDESTVDIVVVGEESVESDVCVDVLSRC